MATLILHVATIGSVKHGILQPDDYASLSSIVGIKKAGANEIVDSFNTVNNLRRSGKLVKLSCRLQNKKVNTVMCCSDKLQSAMGSLIGKSLGGSTITRVSIPRKRSRG